MNLHISVQKSNSRVEILKSREATDHRRSVRIKALFFSFFSRRRIKALPNRLKDNF
jgi:hypothetical protein